VVAASARRLVPSMVVIQLCVARACRAQHGGQAPAPAAAAPVGRKPWRAAQRHGASSTNRRSVDEHGARHRQAAGDRLTQRGGGVHLRYRGFASGPEQTHRAASPWPPSGQIKGEIPPQRPPGGLESGEAGGVSQADPGGPATGASQQPNHQPANNACQKRQFPAA